MMFHLEETLKIVSVSSPEKMAHIWNEREDLLTKLCRYALTWADRECTVLITTSALGIKEQSKADPVSIQSFQWRNQTNWKTQSGQSFLLGSDDIDPSCTTACEGAACIGVPVTETNWSTEANRRAEPWAHRQNPDGTGLEWLTAHCSHFLLVSSRLWVLLNWQRKFK